MFKYNDMKTVYFFPEGGQFYDNLFRYFAAEIIKKLYGYDEVKPSLVINLEFNTIVTDEAFKKIIEFDQHSEVYPLDTSKDILMMGAFQRSEILEKYRDMCIELFNVENNSYISNRIKVSNILKYVSKHTIEPAPNDLVMHIQLGDDAFNKDKNTSEIFNSSDLKDIIKTITYDKLYIIVSSPKSEWEKEYLSAFDDLSPTYISAGIGDDFDFLLKASKILASAHPISWMAAYLGKSSEVYIPYNSYYGGYEGYNQSLSGFSDKCKVYYSISYWVPQIKDEETITE